MPVSFADKTETKKDKSNVPGAMKRELSFGGVTQNEKIFFAQNLALMLNSGLSVNESLDIIQAQAKGKMKTILLSINRAVASGNTLTSVLAKYPKIFSNFFINTVGAGEASGTLEGNLTNLADQLTKDKEFRDKIKSAMFYPAIVLVLSLILGTGMAFFILPKITPIFQGLDVELPASTKILLWISGLVETYGWKLLLALFGGISIFLWLIRRKIFQPITHIILLKLPILGGLLVRKNLAQFSRIMGTLLKSGIMIDKAVHIAEDTTSNYYYRRSLHRVAGNIGYGSKLSENLSKYKSFFPVMTISMIRVEKSGKLEETFFNLADIYEKEADDLTKKMAIAVEPIMLIFIGLIVGGLALSIITPIYKITGSVYK